MPQHMHLFDDGRETGPEIVDPQEPTLHHHEVNGMVTSTEPFGENHTHTFDGEETGAPVVTEEEAIILEDDGSKPKDDDEEEKSVARETKSLGGYAIEVKQEDRNGVPVGIVKGYIATWDLDRGAFGVRDKFIKGAFLDSINELRQRNRPIRLKDHHGRTIGGFPISTVLEDERGLFGVGEINLEVQQGKEAFSLAQQGVLSDFSIGFTPLEDVIKNTEDGPVREITRAIVWEGSIVDEPMNPAAVITEVKNASIEDVEDWTEKDLEKALHEGTKFSKKAARFLVSQMKASNGGDNGNSAPYNEGDLDSLLGEIKSLTKHVTADE